MKYKYSLKQICDILFPEKIVGRSEIHRFGKILNIKFPACFYEVQKLIALKLKRNNLCKVLYFEGVRKKSDCANIILQILPIESLKNKKVLVIDSSSHNHLSDFINLRYNVTDPDLGSIIKVTQNIDLLSERFGFKSQMEKTKILNSFKKSYDEIIISIDDCSNFPIESENYFFILNLKDIYKQYYRLITKKSKIIVLNQGSFAKAFIQKYKFNNKLDVHQLNYNKKLDLNINFFEQKTRGYYTLNLLRQIIFFYN